MAPAVDRPPPPPWYMVTTTAPPATATTTAPPATAPTSTMAPVMTGASPPPTPPQPPSVWPGTRRPRRRGSTKRGLHEGIGQVHKEGNCVCPLNPGEGANAGRRARPAPPHPSELARTTSWAWGLQYAPANCRACGRCCRGPGLSAQREASGARRDDDDVALRVGGLTVVITSDRVPVTWRRRVLSSSRNAGTSRRRRTSSRCHLSTKKGKIAAARGPRCSGAISRRTSSRWPRCRIAVGRVALPQLGEATTPAALDQHQEKVVDGVAGNARVVASGPAWRDGNCLVRRREDSSSPRRPSRRSSPSRRRVQSRRVRPPNRAAAARSPTTVCEWTPRRPNLR